MTELDITDIFGQILCWMVTYDIPRGPRRDLMRSDILVLLPSVRKGSLESVGSLFQGSRPEVEPGGSPEPARGEKATIRSPVCQKS